MNEFFSFKEQKKIWQSYKYYELAALRHLIRSIDLKLWIC